MRSCAASVGEMASSLTDDWTEEKHEENHEGGYPCNRARRVLPQRYVFVVSLEDADTI